MTDSRENRKKRKRERLEKLQKQRRSLTAKTVRRAVLSCVLLGAVALFIGLGFYGYDLISQYIRHAFDTASHASVSVSHGTDSLGFASQVMAAYRALTPQEREATGTEEYRARFAGISPEEGGAYDTLMHILAPYLSTSGIDDVYLAMYDLETSAMVYFVDPGEEGRLYPGEWEPEKEKTVRKFLSWDGNGVLYDIGHTEKYGWLGTAGVPIRDADGAIRLFVLVDVSIDNVVDGMKVFALQVSVGVLAVSVVIAWTLTRRMKRTLVAPVTAIMNAALSYVQDKRAGLETGNHFANLGIHTQDEVEDLSLVLADMERSLTEHEKLLTRVAAEKERIGTELHTAALIQSSMLPHIFPPYPNRREFDLYASMDPAKEVGGDFYDFFLIDEDHLCLVMADVSGKGVPAALFMMISKVILQSCAMLGRSAGEILTKTNEALCTNNQVQMFVTVWLGILEISTGRLVAANAGHEYPALREPNGDFALFKDRHGFVIGGMEGVKYREYELQLKPGSKLFVYTDGVPEATNAREELFGTGRMIAALNEVKAAPPQAVLQGVRRAVDGFVDGAEQFDDLTMLCLEYRGPQSGNTDQPEGGSCP